TCQPAVAEVPQGCQFPAIVGQPNDLAGGRRQETAPLSRIVKIETAVGVSAELLVDDAVALVGEIDQCVEDLGGNLEDLLCVARPIGEGDVRRVLRYVLECHCGIGGSRWQAIAALPP